jgi:hypothetical protein
MSCPLDLGTANGVDNPASPANLDINPSGQLVGQILDQGADGQRCRNVITTAVLSRPSIWPRKNMAALTKSQNGFSVVCAFKVARDSGSRD